MSEDNSNDNQQVVRYKNGLEYHQVLTDYTFKLPIREKLDAQYKTSKFMLKDTKLSCDIDIHINRSMTTFFLLHNIETAKSYNCHDIKFQEISIEENGLEMENTFTIENQYAECNICNYSNTYSYEFFFVIEHWKVIKTSLSIIADHYNIYKNIRKIYEDKIFADIKINVQDKEFWAHKMILSQSTVFAAMFSHEMQENIENVINIKDIDPELFEVVLKFLYTNEINIKIITEHIFLDLITIADIYQLENLKNQLIERAIIYLTIDNVMDTLVFAEKLNIAILKESCMSFILWNNNEIQCTKSFQNFLKIHPTLAANVLNYVLKNIKRRPTAKNREQQVTPTCVEERGSL
ncbi:speckle-type POZ protein B-like [Vespula squamosa]|uniref:Speckle-type POZ protein B-like n=1 Tax=Vespula squamosa TaxID=30214 RepID=A0ABD2AUX3_VESSQ